MPKRCIHKMLPYEVDGDIGAWSFLPTQSDAALFGNATSPLVQKSLNGAECMSKRCLLDIVRKYLY